MLKDMRSYNNLIYKKFFAGWAFLICAVALPCLAYSDTGGATVSLDEPESQTETSSSSTQNLEDLESGVRRFHKMSPHWGLELASSFNALGGQAFTREQGTNPAYAFSAQLEYQPPWIQKYGVLGIGPSVAIYPIFNAKATTSPFSLLAVGGQIRYQARYFREQPVVPVVGYAVEYLNYAFTNGKSGNLVSSGPVLGLWILLNVLGPSSAADFYLDFGVLRSYLILEVRNLTAQDSQISFSGQSYFVGLRFEF